MFNQIHRADEIKSEHLPFPETKGHPTMQVLNADPTLGPGLLRIVMQPGDVIARHYHVGMTETLYILEGVFVNENIPHPAGTELNVKPNTHHGPHTTPTGVTLLAMFTGKVDLTDLKLSKGVE
jgi:quercetin dioxygenase-like cupin family protein